MSVTTKFINCLLANYSHVHLKYISEIDSSIGFVFSTVFFHSASKNGGTSVRGLDPDNQGVITFEIVQEG